MKLHNREKILSYFFNDPLRYYGLRELSRLTKIAPPSVKNYLDELKRKKLIIKGKLRGYVSYIANHDSETFRIEKKLFSLTEIYRSDLIHYLDMQLTPDAIILFGSVSRGEDIMGSDIDVFVQSERRKLNLKKYEFRLKRKISLFYEENFEKISNELKNNILNGIKLKGYIDVYEDSYRQEKGHIHAKHGSKDT